MNNAEFSVKLREAIEDALVHSPKPTDETPCETTYIDRCRKVGDMIRDRPHNMWGGEEMLGKIIVGIIRDMVHSGAPRVIPGEVYEADLHMVAEHFNEALRRGLINTSSICQQGRSSLGSDRVEGET